MPFTMSACDYQVTGVSAYHVSTYLKQRFGDHRLIQHSPDTIISNLKYKTFGQLDITEHSYGSEVEIKVPALRGIYQLQVMLRGSCTWSSNGQQLHLRSGDSAILTPKEEFSMRYSPDCRKLIVKIPQDFLQTTAREFGYLSSNAPIRFKREGLPFSRSAAIHNLLVDILDQDASTRPDRVSLYYAKLLGNALLSTYTNDLSQSQYLDKTDNRHIELIRNYILDNITNDLPIDNLASFCRISRKSLFNLFEREVGMTPSAYIRGLKMEAVYSELSNNSSIRNVTEVALKYGFTNLGRFSAQYRDHVGELPSETLRRLGY